MTRGNIAEISALAFAPRGSGNAGAGGATRLARARFGSLAGGCGTMRVFLGSVHDIFLSDTSGHKDDAKAAKFVCAVDGIQCAAEIEGENFLSYRVEHPTHTRK